MAAAVCPMIASFIRNSHSSQQTPQKLRFVWSWDRNPTFGHNSLQICSLIYVAVAAAAMSLQSCPTLCDPIDSLPPGSSVPGILQARTLEWVSISFSNAW